MATTIALFVSRLSSCHTSFVSNYGIVAHVDHGKSTLADRLLEMTRTIQPGGLDQVLDTLEVERARGITVKAQTATMLYRRNAAEDDCYLLNLIDTPGHVDFSYEVSRSMSACDGVVLLVDATQGVQAQTVANFWLAFEQNLTLLPTLNKIDMEKANPETTQAQLQTLFDIDPVDCVRVSAKSGEGVAALLEALVDRIPPPSNSDRVGPLRALIFDTWYTPWRGAVCLVVVKTGRVKQGTLIVSCYSGKQYEVQEVGIMHPGATPTSVLEAGQVGYVIANMKEAKDALVGDTLIDASHLPQATTMALPGFRAPKPTVFSGLFPVDAGDYDALRSAVGKLALNDPSVTLENDVSLALGPGWRVGFLGLLHMEVFGQRLDNEYDAAVVLTAPTVTYRAKIKDNEKIRNRYGGTEEIDIMDPSKFPNPADVVEFYEPFVLATILTPSDYLSQVASLCETRRGTRTEMSYMDGERVLLKYELPMAEIMTEFYDRLKAVSSGYASFDYERIGYRPAPLTKILVQVNGRPVDEFSFVCYGSSKSAEPRRRAKSICQRLIDELPQQQYEVIVSAHLGESKSPIAMSKKKAARKDFGGKMKGNMALDRLQKLVKLQAKGKQRMKSIGNVQIPKEAFINVFRAGS